MRKTPLRSVLPLLLLAAGCGPVDQITEYFSPESPHAAYVHALGQAGLSESALARDWLASAERALTAAPRVAVPIEESGYLSAEEAAALGYRFSVRRGQQIRVEASLLPDSGAIVFLDVYRLDPDGTRPPTLVASADSATRTVEFEPWRSGEYVLRVQPELLRGGQYRVRIVAEASLAFPVSGRSTPDVGSVFGDARDGGRRNHHGIDIFAPRGTPVIAAANGYVTSIRETPRGGKVVWLRDERRGLSIYYAHLDRQLVENGARVEVGDTLGLVGNTGNARTTPPHLHFGIYQRGSGPIDPLDFVRPLRSQPPATVLDTRTPGEWIRTDAPTALRAGAATDAPIVRQLPALTAVRVVGASGEHWRVRTPLGEEGYIAGARTETMRDPIEQISVTQRMALHAEPAQNAAVMDSVTNGSSVAVLGRYGDYLLVRADTSRGWLLAAR